MIHLVGPGGVGKTTTGAALARRLGREFVDLDRRFVAAFGDISDFLRVHGYAAYAAKNVEVYIAVTESAAHETVLALSSGFMTYAEDVHPRYATLRREIAASATTVVLMPSLDCETCVAETVRRQVGRAFSRSAIEEEQVIRDRFPIYRHLAAAKVETMRPVAEVVEDVVAALPPSNSGPMPLLGGPARLLLALSAIGGIVTRGHAQTIRDSAGIHIVAYPVTAKPSALWRIDPKPMLQLGGEERGKFEEFTRIVGLLRLPNGTVVVGNAGTNELRYFGDRGQYLGKAGRTGGGPGEFSQLTRLLVVGDTIVAVDGTGSTTKFSSSRTLLGVMPRPATVLPGAGSVVGYFGDGSPVYSVTHPSDVQARSGSVIVYVSILKLSKGRVVTRLLDHVPAVTMFGSEHGAIQRVFDGVLRWSLSASRVCASDAAGFRVRCVNSNGVPTTLISWDRTPRVVNAAMQSAFVRAIAASPMPSEASGMAAAPSSRARVQPVFAKTLPWIARMHQTLDGDLWVQAYAPEIAVLAARHLAAPSEPTDWTVFAPDGRMLAAVQLPPRFVPFEMGRDYVLGVTRDDDDVELVTLYRLIRGP